MFGPYNLQLAEDVTQETFLKAIDDWHSKGVPDNAAAWLFAVARNKAIDVIRRHKKEHQYAENVAVLLQSEYSLAPTLYNLINNHSPDDDRLRMMFVCCHPLLSSEASITLILRIICGLSIAEIAKAFITNHVAIEKRLYRAKQTFRDNKIAFELPDQKSLQGRLERVLLCIYLLFNEGYNSMQYENLLRTELMQEALQLCELICRSPDMPHEEPDALMALMCFIAARNDARLDSEGNIVLLKRQNRSKWNRQLIDKGITYLEKSAAGNKFTRYHLEAGIAYEHIKAKDYAHINWQRIVDYYNLLFRLQPSPVIALNRAIAISELRGAAAGLEAIDNIEGVAFLKNYYLLPATLGELNFQLKQYKKAALFFEEAMRLTKSAAEKKLLKNKLSEIKAISLHE